MVLYPCSSSYHKHRDVALLVKTYTYSGPHQEPETVSKKYRPTARFAYRAPFLSATGARALKRQTLQSGSNQSLCALPYYSLLCLCLLLHSSFLASLSDALYGLPLRRDYELNLATPNLQGLSASGRTCM